MLKVFDKSYDTAPFLQNKISTYQIQKKQLFILSILSLGATINFGYIFLIHFSISLLTFGIIIWGIQFFHKSLFSDTEQWKITMLTYILCLSPAVSFTENILGITILFIFGITLLTLNNKNIINPVLLGILGAHVLNINYSDNWIAPIPYIMQTLNQLYPQQTFLENFIISNHFVAGYYDFISPSVINQLNTNNLTALNSQHKMLWFLISPENSWFGAGSPILLILILSSFLFINFFTFTSIFLYLLTYILILLFLQLTQNGFIDLFPYIKNSNILFTAIILLNSSTQPQNKKGIYIFSSLTATLTALLNFRQYLSINYIFVLIITNLASPLIEYFCKKRIFGTKSKENIYKAEYKYFHKLRIFIGIILFIISMSSAKFFFQTPILDRQEDAQLKIVQRFFPEDIIQQSSNHPNVYHILSKQSQYAIYTKTSFYRSTIEILIELDNSTIKNIEIISLKTAHTYYNNLEWLNLFIDTDINKLELTLIEHKESIAYDKDLLLVKTLVQGLEQAKATYNTFLEGN